MEHILHSVDTWAFYSWDTASLDTAYNSRAFPSLGYYLTPESLLWDICRSFLTDSYNAKEVFASRGIFLHLFSCLAAGEMASWQLWRQRCWWITEDGCSVPILNTLFPVWPNCLDGIHYSPPQSLFVKWPKCLFFFFGHIVINNISKFSSIRERSADFDKQHFPVTSNLQKVISKGLLTKGL